MSYIENEDYEEMEYEIENIKKEENEKILELNCNLEVLKNQIVNEIKYKVKDMVKNEITSDVKKEIITDNFQNMLRESIQKLLIEEANKIFDEGIKITNSWGEEKETKTFRDLIKEKVKEELNRSGWRGDTYSERFRDNVEKTIKSEIENQMKEISKNVKSNIENIFNDVTKRELSDSMFNLLMQNETYQKLNNSIKLLGK
nr:MAG TPA: hypothetical protein [Caudoviricetes sp.]